MNVKIPVQLLEGGTLPTYAREGDAGMDVYARTDALVRPGESVAVPVGIKVAIPVGYEIQVRPRSGLSLKTALRVANAPGTIDAGYRDEVAVILENTAMMGNSNLSTLTNVAGDKDFFHKNGSFQIHAGDRIAQIVLKEVDTIEWEGVDDVLSIGKNRGGGLGHSGVRKTRKQEQDPVTGEAQG